MTNSPFVVGAVVVNVRYHNGSTWISGRAKVSKVLKTNNIVLESESGGHSMGQFNVKCLSRSASDLTAEDFYARRCGDSYGEGNWKVLTEELQNRLDLSAQNSRQTVVANYIADQLKTRETRLSADQLARIVAIMNEGK